jgi:hypothetical protein
MSLEDPDCSTWLTLAGSTSAGGCMHIYRDMVKYGMIDAIVATEDRQIFADKLNEIKEKLAPSITAETLGQSVMTQFESLRYKQVRLPFVDTIAKARDALQRIEKAGPMAAWARAIEHGLALKRATGASFAELLASARSMTSHGGLSLRQAVMAACAPMLIKRAMIDGDAERGLMATGLVAGRLGDLPSCAELLAGIEADARARIAVLTGAAPQLCGAA